MKINKTFLFKFFIVMSLLSIIATMAVLIFGSNLNIAFITLFIAMAFTVIALIFILINNKKGGK